MNNRSQWMASKQRGAYVFLAAGILLALTGAVLERWAGNLPFDPRIVTGLGILLLGVALSRFVTYRSLRADGVTAARTMAEEKDERRVAIRNQAGNRAFWVATILGYAGLLWASFASNAQLPALEGDTLWFYLVVLVVIPFAIYLISYARGINQ